MSETAADKVKSLFTPEVSHRFLASFFFNNIPSPLDLRFQKISGLNRELETSAYREGGENISNLHFPERITHGSLVLERGVMDLTPLTWVFNDAMGGFNIRHATVVIMLLNHASAPVCSWTLTRALPVKWHTSDLDANSNAVLINTLELAYEDMRWLGGKA